VAALMAALELQSGDEGRGREWMARAFNARRDPAWTADGFVSDHWLPISPVTGRLDAFEWKDPLAGEEHAGAVIDAERHVMLEPPAASSAAAAAAAAALASAAAAASASPPTDAQLAPQTPPLRPKSDVSDFGLSKGDRTRGDPGSVASGEREHAEREEREHTEALVGESLSKPPPVIPLVQAPDDPGPSANAEVPPDPAPEGPDAPPADGWTRFRGMFKS
jgi:HemY protein